MSLSKLSKLPPEVLSSVLNNQAIPLRRRFRLRLLSNRWADIIEDGLKKETSLVVRDEKADYPKRKPDDLIIQSTDPTDEFIRPLFRLFTSLTQLIISFGVEASWSKIPSLLGHLDTTNLTTVKLYGSARLSSYEQFEPIAIATALTALSALTSLTLVGSQFSVRPLPLLKTVLSRLEKFGCEDYFDFDSSISSGLSSRSTHLWLASADFESELSNNLTHLHLTFCDNTTWQSISQMHALRSLTLHFISGFVLDSSFFSHLAHFSGLTQVNLYSLIYGKHLALPSKNEKPLSSIKSLTLEGYFPLDNPSGEYQAFLQAISAWFPTLAHLTILIWPGNIPDTRTNGKLSFSVKIVDRNSADIGSPDW